MELWMWTGMLVALLAGVALYSSVLVLPGLVPRGRIDWWERFGSAAALLAAALALVTFVLYVLGA